MLVQTLHQSKHEFSTKNTSLMIPRLIEIRHSSEDWLYMDTMADDNADG
jgi:hypothetical protein